MKYRKLRIAWSVAWGIVAVLLVALWVRSYWRCDFIYRVDAMGPYSLTKLVGSESGYLYYKSDIELGGPTPCWWTLDCQDEAQPVKYGWENSRRTRKMMARHPFVAIVPIILAAIPWFGKLGLRFTTRTLLIATTLAVGLGLIVWLR